MLIDIMIIASINLILSILTFLSNRIFFFCASVVFCSVFLKQQHPGLFLFFSSSSHYNSNLNWKIQSVDVVHGIRNRGYSMAGAEGSAELWLFSSIKRRALH